MSQNENNWNNKIPLEGEKKQSVLAAFKKKQMKILLAAGLVLLILYSVVPGTWLLRPQEIQRIRITQITYPNGVMGAQYHTIMIQDKEMIARFGANFANTLLVFLPDDGSVSSYGVTDESVNYFVTVDYETTSQYMNLFDNYGNPLRINGRTLWFSLFHPKKMMYQEIDMLFREAAE